MGQRLLEIFTFGKFMEKDSCLDFWLFLRLCEELPLLFHCFAKRIKPVKFIFFGS